MPTDTERDTLSLLGHPYYDRDSEAAPWLHYSVTRLEGILADCAEGARNENLPRRDCALAELRRRGVYGAGAVSHA